MGCLPLIQHYHDKLPETWQYLQAVSETRIDFAYRRIAWAIEWANQNGETMAVWKIFRIAGIKEDLAPEVYKKTLEMLQDK